MAKLVAYASIACSTLALLLCLIMIPTLYLDITDLHDSILNEMGEFKVLADDLWVDMMAMRSESVSNGQHHQQSFTFTDYIRPKRLSPVPPKCRKTRVGIQINSDKISLYFITQNATPNLLVQLDRQDHPVKLAWMECPEHLVSKVNPVKELLEQRKMSMEL